MVQFLGVGSDALASLHEEGFVALGKIEGLKRFPFDQQMRHDQGYMAMFFTRDNFEVKLTHQGRQRISEERQEREKSTILSRGKRIDERLQTAFNTYIIVEKSIGTGGSGTVHVVEDIDGEKYALKVLHSQAGTTKTKRFQHEILFCSRNNHRNIIRVLDHGVSEGPDGDPMPFYVMPLYPTTLRKLMAKGIPQSEVLPLFSHILDGLEAAHLKGVLHRDLKPENILCDPERSTVVIADFGIAKFQEEDLYTAVETSKHDRMANFLYSAPEQRVRGKQVTGAADIFAVGLILNEMFTGEIPQGSGYKRIASVASDRAYLDGIVDQLIQQAPDQRLQTVARIKEELIAQGNIFVNLQRLDALQKKVVPENEIDDPLITDPVRLVQTLDYSLSDSTLTIRLNRPVNDAWKGCFMTRATRFTANVSSAIVTFQGDTVRIIVSEHSLQEGINFVKEYIPVANEQYAAVVRREHQKEIDRRRAALKGAKDIEEARIRIMQKVHL
jgi:serine/threonine protein kinase